MFCRGGRLQHIYTLVLHYRVIYSQNPSDSCGEVYYVLQGLRAFTTSWVLLLDWLKSGIKKSLEINPSQDVTLFSDDIKKAQEVLCIACRTASATWLPCHLSMIWTITRCIPSCVTLFLHFLRVLTLGIKVMAYGVDTHIVWNSLA